jgi:hypothetical protein
MKAAVETVGQRPDNAQPRHPVARQTAERAAIGFQAWTGESTGFMGWSTRPGPGHSAGAAFGVLGDLAGLADLAGLTAFGAFGALGAFRASGAFSVVPMFPTVSDRFRGAVGLTRGASAQRPSMS